MRSLFRMVRVVCWHHYDLCTFFKISISCFKMKGSGLKPGLSGAPMDLGGIASKAASALVSIFRAKDYVHLLYIVCGPAAKPNTRPGQLAPASNSLLILLTPTVHQTHIYTNNQNV